MAGTVAASPAVEALAVTIALQTTISNGMKIPLRLLSCSFARLLGGRVGGTVSVVFGVAMEEEGGCTGVYLVMACVP
jgi:hypothetical protein